MKNLLKKSLPILLVAAVLAMCGTVTSCSSSKGTKRGNGSMYERHQTNRGSKVKSNIKVRGSNKSNGHTTRSY
ncbi:MAG: hypothetical protein IK058_03585 [Bacteroidales bacterium]|nr:hypothetical protein [Bacteroidales bacterium]